MDNKLLFAPPTDDELKILGVSNQKNENTKEDENLSPTMENLHDTAAGIGQGATLGFGDEALGALQATGEKIKGNKADWTELYRQHQKENQADWEKMKNRSPWATGLGELAGGFLLPGGAITAAEGAAGKLGVAAGLGALSGIGNSKGSLENADQAKQLAEDTGIGGTLGTAVGAAAPYIGKGAGALKNKINEMISDVPYANIYRNAIQQGLKSGQTYFGTNVEQGIENLTNAKTSDILGRLESGAGTGNDVFNKFLSGTKVEFSPESQSALGDYLKVLERSPVSDTDAGKKSIDLVKSMMAGDVDAQTIKTLEQQAYSKFMNADPALKDIYGNFGLALKQGLKDTPGYNEAFNAWQMPRKAGEALIGKNLPSNYTVQPADPNADILQKLIPSDRWGAYTPEEKAAGIKNVLEKLAAPKGIGTEERGSFQKFQDQLTELQKNPEGQKVLQNMGLFNPDADIGQAFAGANSAKTPPNPMSDFIKGIQQQGTQEATLQRIQGKGSFANNTTIGGQLNSTALNSASVAAAGLGNLSKPIRYLYNMGDSQLQSIAQNISQIPGLQSIGNALSKALTNKSTIAKNAVLFTMAQNPKIRALIPGLGGDENDSIPNSPFAPQLQSSGGIEQ